MHDHSLNFKIMKSVKIFKLSKAYFTSFMAGNKLNPLCFEKIKSIIITVFRINSETFNFKYWVSSD